MGVNTLYEKNQLLADDLAVALYPELMLWTEKNMHEDPLLSGM